MPLGRQQRLGVNGTTSEWFPVSCGIPLDKLLFVIYIFDLDTSLLRKVSKFADNTSLGANVGFSAIHFPQK